MMKVLVVLLSFLPSSFIFAEDSTMNVKSSLTWYSTASFQKPVEDTPINPDNAIIGVESRVAAFDLRPSVKLEAGNLQLVARPQIKSSVSQVRVAKHDGVEHPQSSARWLDAYGSLNASDKIQVSYGLQNYQWGAAESFNPSNRIFHENIDARGLLYAVQGRHLARVNISWSQSLSSVLVSQTEQEKDSSTFHEGETFQTKSLMKHEVNWNSGADYLGLVYGAGETGSPWIGEYFNLSLIEGLTIYGDASHQKNSESWYPTTDSNKTVQLEQSKRFDNKTYTLAVGGLRYSFEGGSDIRFEYILNSAGWSKNDSLMALTSLDKSKPAQMPNYQVNLKRILYPGLEYRGQRYLMASLRYPDAFGIKDLVIYGRNLRSLTDQSASYFGSLEYAFWTSSTFILSGYMTRGQATEELRGVVASSVTSGLRQDF